VKPIYRKSVRVVMKKGDIVEHVRGGYGEVRAVEKDIAVVRVLKTCFHDIRRIPVSELEVVSDEVREALVG